MENEFDKEEYTKINLECYQSNSKMIDIICLVINAILLTFQTTILVKITLIIMLLNFIVCLAGNNLAIDENYCISNKIFDFCDIVDIYIVILTVITIIRVV